MAVPDQCPVAPGIGARDAAEPCCLTAMSLAATPIRAPVSFCLIGAVDRLRCDDLTLRYLVRVARTRHERCPFGHPVLGAMERSLQGFRRITRLSRRRSGTGDRRSMEIDAFACVT